MFLIKNDVELMNERGFLKNDNNHLCLKFINVIVD